MHMDFLPKEHDIIGASHRHEGDVLMTWVVVYDVSIKGI